MAADNFTWEVRTAINEMPEFANIESTMDSFKKEYLNLDDTPIEKIKVSLIVDVYTRNDIYAQVLSAKSNYESFLWLSVPWWINGYPQFSVRYDKQNGYQERFIQGSQNLWEINITFEKAND